MAYSDFTFAKLKRNFGLEQEDTHLFQDVTIIPFVPSQHLLDDVAEAKDMPQIGRAHV